jgi:phage baseplate assembly protein W
MVISKNFLTPLLPLAESGELEYEHIGEYRALIKQNFKNLILTIPGERMMDPDFGVGIQRFLFETSIPFASSEIQSQISLKLGKYMPFVRLDNVLVEAGEEQATLKVRIFYGVPTLAIDEYINLSFSDDGRLIS